MRHKMVMHPAIQLMFKQILSTGTMQNTLKQVIRICMLILGLKGLKSHCTDWFDNEKNMDAV